MNGSQDGQLPMLIQRLLTRMDFIEHNLVRHANDEVSELRSTVGRIQRARRLESEAVEDARPQAVPSHRGPGSLAGPTPARAMPEEVINTEFFEAAQAAQSPQPSAPTQDADPGNNPFAIGAGMRPSPAPASPDDQASEGGTQKRRGFSNLLVKSREASAKGTPTQGNTIMSTTAQMADEAPM